MKINYKIFFFSFLIITGFLFFDIGQTLALVSCSSRQTCIDTEHSDYNGDEVRSFCPDLENPCQEDGPGERWRCCDTRCPTAHTDYICVDATGRTDCFSSLCPGGASIKCCPIRSGGGTPPAPVCGNGVTESGEECDDRNTVDGDGCSSACRTEAPTSVPSGAGTGALPSSGVPARTGTGTETADSDSGAGGIRSGLGESSAGLVKFDIATKIGDVISTVLGFVGIVFLILMIYGGLMWMTAGGKEEQLGKAKKTITAAVVGMIIVFSAYAITYFITTTLLGGGA